MPAGVAATKMMRVSGRYEPPRASSDNHSATRAGYAREPAGVQRHWARCSLQFVDMAPLDPDISLNVAMLSQSQLEADAACFTLPGKVSSPAGFWTAAGYSRCPWADASVSPSGCDND
jgi:hypothetical protein